MRRNLQGQSWLALAFVLSLAMAACSVKWVADYDQVSADRIGAAYERMDKLYEHLASTPAVDRTYEKFAAEWGAVATDFRSLSLRQKTRPDNEASARIIELMVKHWERTRNAHKQRSADPVSKGNAYPDDMLVEDRKDFEAQFVAALSAERFKQ